MSKQFAKVITYGCQMNENDSEKLKKMISDFGYEFTDDEKKADLIVMNTCSVRENANERFFGNLGMYKHIKEKVNKDLIIAVCGCMMQQEEVVRELLKKYTFVDIIFGTHNISDFPMLLTKRLKTPSQVYKIEEKYIEDDDNLETKREFKHKALIKIMSGCDNFCSYCIVPYTRGREQSRSPQDIISEIERLRDDGVKEVMLLGQNVNSYGKRLNEDINFPRLLERVAKLRGIERIRFMTSHPKDLSDDLIDVISKYDNVCPHVHLPVQSGSNKVLRDMNRHYTREQYIAIVDKMRDKIKDFSLSTDIIVGFPTETNEDFEETLNLVRYCRFDNIFTFIYSKREHTKAKDIPAVLQENEIKENFNKLLSLQKEMMSENTKKYFNTVQTVFIDSVDTEKHTKSGHTASNLLVNFTGEGEVGDRANVKITKTMGFYLLGERIH